ncbi:MAG: methionine synthase [Firmicutes bacterium]|nr:methionine synthase [Bacillota bacterium]
MAKILGAPIGECVHVAGTLNFLRLAAEQGYQTEFLGAATPLKDVIGAIRETDPDIVAISYRLTPETGYSLLLELKQGLEEAGLLDRRFVFGGTPPVAEKAKEVDLFEVYFTGEEPMENVIAWLKGQDIEARTEADFPDELVARLEWKKPFPVIRHHFGFPADSIDPTVEGIKKIAEAEILDVLSLGPDQDAQENFFTPEKADPSRRGAGGVPIRSEADYETLYEATRRGNYPLMRSYSGTAQLLRYGEMLRRTIKNAWCATSIFWFNRVDGRGPMTLQESIEEHLRLMKWHGDHDVPVEANEPHHWELRDGHDVVAVVSAYLSAYLNKKMGVKNYIATYMFNTPPTLSDKMDLAKMLAKAELAEALEDKNFRCLRQTRTGLLSYPVDPHYAIGQLGASVYVQMAMQPDIIHVVGYCEAHHAATAEDVIESCKIARKVIQNCLHGMPDMTHDPEVIERKEELKQEAQILINAIRALGGDKVEDPLADPATLAKAVEIGLMDTPQLKGNPYACGEVVTKPINGAIYAVDPETDEILPEEERVARIFKKYGI